MNDHIQQAVNKDNTIDITTIGRKSGQPQRIEIWFRRVNGRFLNQHKIIQLYRELASA